MTLAVLGSRLVSFFADQISCISELHYVPDSGKLSREKTFTNFAVLEPPAKVFSTKFGRTVPNYVRFWHSAKVFSAKWPLLPIRESFLSKVSRYTVYRIYICMTSARDLFSWSNYANTARACMMSAHSCGYSSHAGLGFSSTAYAY